VKYSVFTAVLIILVTWRASATHLRSADIKVEPVCGSPYTFRITVIAYLNTLSNTRFGTSSEVHFGDGRFVRIPTTVATPRPDLGKNIAVASYVTTYTYQTAGTYLVTYMERDRSTGVLNIENSLDVPYVTNITIDISEKFGCNNYPVLAVPPLDRACHKSTFYHTSGAYDVDGDSLSYELAVPLATETTQAAYTTPVHPRYYTDPAHGNEALTSPAAFSINELTGLLTWDAPGMIGEYNIAFRILEWRKNGDGKYERISTTTRDMQIIVEECHNIRPDLIVPLDTCVVAGSLIDIVAKGTDADGHPLKIEVYSEIVDLPATSNPADYSPRPSVFLPANPPPITRLTWSTTCAHVRQQPYQVVFKVTDNPPDGPKLVNFKVWNVRVIGPPPQQFPSQLDLVKRRASLSWSSYECTNAKAIQVWRKVGSYPGAAAYCDIRSPALWGYKLIKELPTASTSFIDDNFGKGLSVGAMYCYRIVAAIADTRSYASQEFCVGPIQADAPVITHVSVVETSTTAGSMQVSWRKPFNINKTQFPEPYEYEVYRASGYIGEHKIVKAGRVTDTTFRDSGINTEESVYNYRIVLYAKPQFASAIVPVDTSAVSSSVWLSAKPGNAEIELQWRDSVSWSNVIASSPWHRIYRSIDNRSPRVMELIDSVDVTIDGFKYVDRGAFKNIPIEEDKYYSYGVMTRGTYGNPLIKPSENFSQVTSTYPLNDLLPCAPVLHVEVQNCEQYVAQENCDLTQFVNHINWSVTGLRGCRKDIASYSVYASSERDGKYALIASMVTDTFYVDKGLNSFARCYRVSAIDKSGTESLLSDSVCNDNCPYYVLPNVFSPNGDGYNDSFHARFKSESPAGAANCPRFVLTVDLTVTNRWGNEVYHRRSEELSRVTDLEWDGRDKNGNELPPGVYYYSADVTFDMLDDENSGRKYKGWVQLLR